MKVGVEFYLVIYLTDADSRPHLRIFHLYVCRYEIYPIRVLNVKINLPSSG